MAENSYNEAHKKQIDKGRPELYADKYAEYSAKGNTAIECFIYADTIEKLMSKGKSEDYAESFAWHYLENIGNYCYLYSEDESSTGCFVEIDRDAEPDPEGMKNWFYQNTVAEMYATDYAYSNRLESKDKFIEKYKDNYFDIHSNNERENNGKSEEQLHELALKETLDEFQKLGYK